NRNLRSGDTPHLLYNFAEFENLLAGAAPGDFVLDDSARFLGLLVRREVISLHVDPHLLVAAEGIVDARPYFCAADDEHSRADTASGNFFDEVGQYQCAGDELLWVIPGHVQREL